MSQENPNHVVQAFIDLVQRHEQLFYNFVHKVHTKGESLFDSLMHWIELFLTVIREGVGQPISLEFILPHTGKERADILAEVDKVALYHYKLKVLYEDKLRRRFGRVQQGQTNDADAEDEATQALVDGVVSEISFGGLMQGDADDLAAEETDEESDSSSEFESTSEEDDSTEEKPAARTPRPPQTPIPPPQSNRTRSRPPPESRTPTRQRAMSLKSSRSMTFSPKHASSQSHDLVPPVPLIPHNSYLSKPLPPDPPSRSSPSTPNAKTPKLRKSNKTLKLPDLHHIPQLLPVFSEIVSHSCGASFFTHFFCSA